MSTLLVDTINRKVTQLIRISTSIIFKDSTFMKTLLSRHPLHDIGRTLYTYEYICRIVLIKLPSGCG